MSSLSDRGGSSPSSNILDDDVERDESPDGAHIADATQAVEVFGHPSPAFAQVHRSVAILELAAREQRNKPKPEGSQGALLCDYCGCILCMREDLIQQRATVWGDQVYTYDLEIFEEEETPVYSATNPSANRFDVVRVKPDVVCRDLIVCSPAYFPDHSWFPPYEWSMASCASCGRHIGWGFAKRNAPVTTVVSSPLIETSSEEESGTIEGGTVGLGCGGIDSCPSEPSPTGYRAEEQEIGVVGSDNGDAACSCDDSDDDVIGGFSASSSPEASPSAAANMEPLCFVGLIVTNAKCEEKLDESFVSDNLAGASRRKADNIEFHNDRKAVTNRFRSHEDRLRSSGQYLTIMTLLNLLDSFSFATRPAMRQLRVAVDELLQTPGHSKSQAAAESEEQEPLDTAAHQGEEGH